MRIRSLTLLATFAAALAVSSAACTGGGGDDDDDDGGTPTPVFEADRCHIVWENDVSAEVRDLYVLDAPVGAWVLGSNLQYSTSSSGFQAAFFGGLDLVTGEFATTAIVTTGTFALVLSGTEANLGVGFDDVDPQSLFAVDTSGDPAAFLGTGGTGRFDGFWSDPYSQNVSPGNGTITVLLEGTARTLGVDLSYAVCYTGDPILFRPPLPGSPR